MPAPITARPMGCVFGCPSAGPAIEKGGSRRALIKGRFVSFFLLLCTPVVSFFLLLCTPVLFF